MTDNRAAFERFVELFYTRKRVREAFDYLVANEYRQHNPTIAVHVRASGPGRPDARGSRHLPLRKRTDR
ncbi:hypothetical protein [Arthrobacter ramosus]|uniref:Uncharacterized protein n=1 Tax=Arthrobacter ramosus TaxID=1672 RepID=A0ABV5XVZ1_ARTRM|nr:hypothetical protein [Arthrobacter ramosus]